MVRRLCGVAAVEQAADAARHFGTEQWLDEDELARLCIVVEELIANLYDHGGLTAEDVVQIEFVSGTLGIEVSITDPGTPFDPWSAQRRVERTERGGGAGIDIVRAWAKFVSYDSASDGNRLVFLLPLRSEG